MKYVILSDGTRINNCTDSTTSSSIFVLKETYEEAGAVRDLFTEENSNVIKVYNADDENITTGFNLILIPGVKLYPITEGIICEINTRIKSDIEIMQDEIEELQEVVLG